MLLTATKVSEVWDVHWRCFLVRHTYLYTQIKAKFISASSFCICLEKMYASIPTSASSFPLCTFVPFTSIFKHNFWVGFEMDLFWSDD